MSNPQIYKGTLDEITARYGKELSGLHLKVTVEDESILDNEVARPFYDAAAPEQWAEALRAWAASHTHLTPLLADEALDRESIYEGRGE